ncbi:MAG: hypothetical protein QNK04_33395 [Myxococcota bacterium]|nr:hypothetical protein [Myxococcota bacterium]
MALGKEIGEFSFQITSTHYSGEEGTVQVNVDGTATGFGTVLGTMTFRVEAPAAKNGALSFRGQGFLENGENVAGAGEGAFEEIGHHQWRTRMIVRTSDGQVFASDGLVDLASRSLKGKNLEWS